jgi:hypothetical protein
MHHSPTTWFVGIMLLGNMAVSPSVLLQPARSRSDQCAVFLLYRILTPVFERAAARVRLAQP